MLEEEERNVLNILVQLQVQLFVLNDIFWLYLTLY